jgi:hypothetical protein
MPRDPTFLFPLVLPVLLAGCAVGGTVGCDFRDGSVNGPEDRCQERSGLQATSFDGACELSGGEVLDGACPDADKVAGCDLGQDVIDWYYAPMTREDAESECGDPAAVIDP